MNYLAHIYLSGENELITIGNFMADSIRGKKYKSFPKEIQIGILLHREIDTFTDAHPVFRKSTKRLHKRYSHYSGVIVDILYDHFLAKNWSKYSDVSLSEYAQSFYNSLEDNYDILPQPVKRLMPFMISDDWLLSYASMNGISRVLEGMNRRTKQVSGMNNAINELEEYYLEFEMEFTIFFEELMDFSQKKLKMLSSQLK